MPTLDFVEVEHLVSSVTPTGSRLDTMKFRYPRIIHSEFMTHRLFSRNASSSRAIPVNKLLADPPYVPEFWKNQPGMQGKEKFGPKKQAAAEEIWLRMAAACHDGVQELAALGVHKQHANRPLEWFGYIDVVVSSTDWVNFVGLRRHSDAQPEIDVLAEKVVDALNRATPIRRGWNDWHLPFVNNEDHNEVNYFVKHNRHSDVFDQIDPLFRNVYLPHGTRLLVLMSAARCARASYRDFDGSKVSLERDIGTAMKLASSPLHATPFEHQARSSALVGEKFNGNFAPDWEQFRKLIPNERIMHSDLLTYGKNPDIESAP